VAESAEAGGVDEASEKHTKRKKMKLDELTIGEVKELRSLFEDGVCGHPFQVGKNYFIRTVTHHLMGKLVAVYPQELVLEDASWIADDGRFAEFLEKGETEELEVEPFPAGEIAVGRGAVIDACIWNFKVLWKQK